MAGASNPFLMAETLPRELQVNGLRAELAPVRSEYHGGGGVVRQVATVIPASVSPLSAVANRRK